jgi:hypothetical protein
MRNLCGTKRDEVKRKWRKLYNEELKIICAPYKVSFGWACSRQGASSACRLLVGRPEGR